MIRELRNGVLFELLLATGHANAALCGSVAGLSMRKWKKTFSSETQNQCSLFTHEPWPGVKVGTGSQSAIPKRSACTRVAKSPRRAAKRECKEHKEDSRTTLRSTVYTTECLQFVQWRLRDARNLTGVDSIWPHVVTDYFIIDDQRLKRAYVYTVNRKYLLEFVCVGTSRGQRKRGIANGSSNVSLNH